MDKVLFTCGDFLCMNSCECKSNCKLCTTSSSCENCLFQLNEEQEQVCCFNNLNNLIVEERI